MFPHSLKSFTRLAQFSIALCFASSTVFSLAGCGRYSRTKQCRALIAQVNPALDDVLTITHAGEASDGGVLGSAAYVAAAGRYERLAKSLGPMEFATEDMAKLVAEYAGVLNSTAQTLRNLAAGLDADNVVEAERANRDLDRNVGHERQLVARMEAWCQP
jgi:hypothetical protein